MAAATITTNPEGYLVSENKVITVSNGETFTTKLSQPFLAQLSWAEAISGTAKLCYALSGRTFTISAHDGGTATSDKLVAITVYGRR
jgi:hypothetical protein